MYETLKYYLKGLIRKEKTNKEKKPPSTQQINSQRADHTLSKRENRNNSLNMFSITDAQKM